MNSSLNHIYRVVWNTTLCLWQVVSEVARRGGKTQSEQRRSRRLKVGAAAVAGAFAGLASIAIPSVALAQLPTGGQVVGGQASIVQSGNALNINQGTDRAAIDWQSFNVGQGNTVNFNQPSASSIALNRVLGNDVSVIQGAINANGQVFLVNQNGILFTPTAQVNVGGIVASTQNISTADFMAGKHTFSGSSTGTVTNQGNITTSNGGTVALIAAKIINTGTITAPQGTVGLAAGNTVTLDLGGPVKIQVTQGALNTAIEQGGGIVADGGQIYLTAKAAGNLAASAINHSGLTQANTIAGLKGSIQVQADLVAQTGDLVATGNTEGGNIDVQAGLLIDSGNTTVDGAIKGGRIAQRASEILQSQSARLSAKGTGTQGQGGQIQILASGMAQSQVQASGEMNASGVARGGSLDITAKSVTLSGAVTNTSGNQQAGKQRIGGGWQGREEDIANAHTTKVLNSTLNNSGQNGTVVVWSDDSTAFGSALNATGSAVEISGKENLAIDTRNIKAQTLLLDPKNIEIKTIDPTINALTIVNPNNNSGDSFGIGFLRLGNGNLVITAPGSDIVGASTIQNVGRVYLYSSTGNLISTLSGVSAEDEVGQSSRINPVGAGNVNFVIRATNFDNGSAMNAGAVTWVNGSTGLNGMVSSINSLVGSTSGDNVGSDFTGLTNGNYLIRSQFWSNEGAASAGATTFARGDVGISGVVSASNSLVGTTASDFIGGGTVLELSNGNYVLANRNWSNGSRAFAGAVTWGSGTSGVIGEVSSSNSLVGTRASDQVGASNRVFAVGEGNYVVVSELWDNNLGDTAVIDAGAVTWGNGTVGVKGVINSENSLIGGRASDRVGLIPAINQFTPAKVGLTILSNGNYVVISNAWDNPAGAMDVGAVTWGSGSAGVTGLISSTNSLIGGLAGDCVGSDGVVEVGTGNYVVQSSNWDRLVPGAPMAAPSTIVDAGAVTWGNGMTGRTGVVDSTNSLVGSSAADRIGAEMPGAITERRSIVLLSDGDYVVRSRDWNNGSITDAGAVTWASGSAGLTGEISSSNSLVGASANDIVGAFGVFALLGNGNYVVVSPTADRNGVVDAGAVTWGNGVSGTVGVVNSSNSLVGSFAGDGVGSNGLVRLSNGNYVFSSQSWDNTTAAPNAGAVTWGSGTSGVSGVLSSENSLVGTSANDNVGSTGAVFALTNGNYVVRTITWDNSDVVDAGAVTWANGEFGLHGVISADNSLLGSTVGDSVGREGITELSNGNYVIRSSTWDNGSATNAGAVTWGSGTSGVRGVVSSQNSLVGSSVDDSVGTGGIGIVVLGNGNYLVRSHSWDNGSAMNAGALTWGNGSVGVTGIVSSTNSLVGTSSSDSVGNGGVTVLNNNNFVVITPGWNNGSIVDAGAVTWGSGASGVSGVVSSVNSLVGTMASDSVGSDGIFQSDQTDKYVIQSGLWDNGTISNAGAFTFVDSTNGILAGGTSRGGSVTQTNSILGSRSSAVQFAPRAGFVGDRFVFRDTGTPQGGTVFITDGTTSTGTGDAVASATFANNPSGNSTITPAALEALLKDGVAVKLQANNDITVTSAVNVLPAGGITAGDFTLEAGRNVTINAAVLTGGGRLVAIAGSPNALAEQRDAGNPTITLGATGFINTGSSAGIFAPIHLAALGSSGRFVNQSPSATPFSSGVTHIYVPTFNTTDLTVVSLGALADPRAPVPAKRYNTTFNLTTQQASSTTASLSGLTGLNLLYAVAPSLTVAPATGQTGVVGQTVALSTTRTLNGFVDGDTEATSGITGAAAFRVAGTTPPTTPGVYDVVYSTDNSTLESTLGYLFEDAATQVGELTLTAAPANPVVPGPVLPGPVLPGPVVPGPELPGPVVPSNPVIPTPSAAPVNTPAVIAPIAAVSQIGLTDALPNVVAERASTQIQSSGDTPTFVVTDGRAVVTGPAQLRVIDGGVNLGGLASSNLSQPSDEKNQ
ncbi:MAG TPA: filamentous hemagglutinin N-terminal domain-containing protein [Limnobacter sp.]|nr:filamentous hemagglutinin N-terminal domain-containing protein [Limnobacter sp.]